jgi:apolipoprotein N-acyltransferase
VLPLICYEAIFPQDLRRTERPVAIVHLTNDAWFGAGAGPRQHLALARLRAAESGLPVLRAANTGISAAIDARGAVTAMLALGAEGHLDAPLPAALPATPYLATGDWPALLITLLGLFAVAARRRGKGLDATPPSP